MKQTSLQSATVFSRSMCLSNFLDLFGTIQYAHQTISSLFWMDFKA